MLFFVHHILNFTKNNSKINVFGKNVLLKNYKTVTNVIIVW